MDAADFSHSPHDPERWPVWREWAAGARGTASRRVAVERLELLGLLEAETGTDTEGACTGRVDLRNLSEFLTRPFRRLPVDRSTVVAATVASLRLEAETVVDLVVDRIVEEIPSYAAVPRERLRPGVAASVHDGIGFLLDKGFSGGTSLAAAVDAAAVGADRAERGIPVEDLLHAYRIGVRTVWERFATAARRNDADPGEVLALAERVWEWADGVMVRAAREHRRVDLEAALDAQQRRGAFIRALLSGTLDRAGLHLQSAVFGLDPDREYVPFRARGGRDARAVVKALVPYFPTRPRPSPSSTGTWLGSSRGVRAAACGATWWWGSARRCGPRRRWAPSNAPHARWTPRRASA
ncbi:hypothetical protein ACQP1W_13645 [Spirillospora sp. CA-255316]